MCGIAGIFHTRDGRPVDPASLTRMADAMAHRGPDGRGVWVDGSIGFAHRRLAVIDLDGGHQPMASPETGAMLTFSGEIYNYRELRAQLQTLNVRFAGQSDTEVVLHAYDRWGDDCVGRFHGMFAFAIWDPHRRKLFAARDRLGIKPFYYHQTEDTFIFASELKALTACRDLTLDIDEAAFESYLRLHYVAAPFSIFKNVRHLPPGHVLIIASDGVLRERRYWRPTPGRSTVAQDTQECRQRLADAVERHLVADVPVGAFLSGGIDSSLIVAHMAALGPVKTFSIGFEGGSRFDERPAAAQVARHLGTSHCERLVTDQDAAASVPGIVSRMDEPLADYAVLPTFFLAEAAAREVKVVLTGEGADELFGGYRRYRKERWLAPLGPWRGAYQASHLFSDSEISRMLGRTARHPPLVSNDEPYGFDSLNRLLLRDLEGWLPDDLLVKVDRITMRCSIEARVPYLDHTFVEFALGVPGHRKVGWLHGRRKMILRESAIGLLPQDVLNRPKHGFTPPIDRWFLGRLGAFAREVLLDPSSHMARRIGSKVIRELLAGQVNGRRNGHKLWALLVYDLWSQHYGIA